MTGPKIFVASSGVAKPLANELVHMIRVRSETIECRLWWLKMPPGQSTLETLIDECQTADFAVVLLTSDDVLVKKGEQDLAPRDNCIFELGLFTGALGADPRRCFMVTSSDRPSLPSDLQGISYIPFEMDREYLENLRHGHDSSMIEMPQRLSDSLYEAAGIIVARVAKLGSYSELRQDNALPYMTSESLLRREQLRSNNRIDGRLQQRGRVLVVSRAPLESDPEFADNIQRNLRQGIRYEYVFQADPGLAERLALLLHMLVTVGVKGKTVYEHMEYMKHVLADASSAEARELDKLIRKNLANMRRNLSIYFVQYQPGIELCVHNATDPNNAHCFLRIPGWDSNNRPRFAAWCEHDAAHRVRGQMLDAFQFADATDAGGAQSRANVLTHSEDGARPNDKARVFYFSPYYEKADEKKRVRQFLDRLGEELVFLMPPPYLKKIRKWLQPKLSPKREDLGI